MIGRVERPDLRPYDLRLAGLANDARRHDYLRRPRNGGGGRKLDAPRRLHARRRRFAARRFGVRRFGAPAFGLRGPSLALNPGLCSGSRHRLTPHWSLSTGTGTLSGHTDGTRPHHQAHDYQEG